MSQSSQSVAKNPCKILSTIRHLRFADLRLIKIPILPLSDLNDVGETSLIKAGKSEIELLREQYSELEFTGDSTIGLVYRGSAELFTNHSETLAIQQGDILWITPGNQSSLKAAESDFQFLCCHLRFGPVKLNPLFDMIPAVLHLKSTEPSRSSLNPIIELLLQESLQQRCGQETVLNRLAEVLLVHVLRYVMKHQKI